MQEILDARKAVQEATERLSKLEDKHESLKASISETEAELEALRQAEDMDIAAIAEAGGKLEALKAVEPDILGRIQHVREGKAAAERDLGHSLSRSLHKRRDATKAKMAECFEQAMNVLDEFEEHCEATFKAHGIKAVRPPLSSEDPLFSSVRTWIKTGHSRRVSAIMKQAVR